MVFGFGTPNVQKMKEKRDVKRLIKALGYQQSSDVRRAAAEALGTIGDGRAVEPLVKALNDSDWLVRRKAAEALGTIGDGRAVEPLVKALNDADSDVRKSVAEALSKIGEPAVEPLIKALNDTSEYVCEGAVEALGKIGWAPGSDEAAAAYWTVKRRWDKCVEIGEPAVEPLIRALVDSD
ncbi:MAG TPA: HEAT repeat domain-containing protein, partial [Candidatus Bathyarchaeia archaeon]|nr:HEAT repeat domain-containing protein [Candidatus Bathyarchaeia archaeon]